MKRILAFVVALALSAAPVLGQSITPQIGGGISKGFDGGISGALAPVIPNQTFNVVSTGDSITIGLGGVPTYAVNALAAMPGASITVVTPNATWTTPFAGGGSATLNNIAVSGISALTLAQNYAAGAGGAGPFFNAAKNINVLTYMAGTNTSGATDANAGQKYGLIRAYLRSGRNTGYQREIVGTLTARDDDGGSFWTTVEVPLNNAIAAYYNSDLQADFLFNFGASPLFSPAAAADNLANYNSDKIHPVTGVAGPPATGQVAMGAIASPSLLSALLGGGQQTFAPPTWSQNCQLTPCLGGNDGTVQLSANFRTATVPTGFANYGIRGFPGSHSGKFYWEGTVTVADGVSVAIASDYFVFNNGTFVGRDAGKNGIGYEQQGSILFGGVGVATAATYQNADNIGVAADFNNLLAWFRRCRAAVCQSWNGNVSADPATGIGGLSFAGGTSLQSGDRWYPAGNVHSGADAISSNFAASQMVNPVPAGFSTFAP